METTITGGIGIKGISWVVWGVYWGYIGIMENKMETTIMGYVEVI